MKSTFVLCIAVSVIMAVVSHRRMGVTGNTFGTEGRGMTELMDNMFGEMGRSMTGMLGDGFQGFLDGTIFGGSRLTCELLRCDGYDICIMEYDRPRCVRYGKPVMSGGPASDIVPRKPMLPGGPEPISVPDVVPEVCKLPYEAGPCQASFRRFYFDIRTQLCQSFVYGGCGSNGNNFETLEDCNLFCTGTSTGPLF